MLQEGINTLQHENMGMQTAITIALEQKKAVPESAVNTALQIIGESLDCDRIQAVITALKRGIVSRKLPKTWG